MDIILKNYAKKLPILALFIANLGNLAKKFKKILKMGIDNLAIVYYNSGVGNIGVPEMEGL